MTLSRSLQCRAFSRALIYEKSLSPLLPVDGGAVVTNDWCIRDKDYPLSWSSSAMVCFVVDNSQ